MSKQNEMHTPDYEPIDYWDWRECDAVEYCRGKMSGAATVGPVRFTADMVLDLYPGGCSVDEMLEDYSLEREPIERILAYAAAKGFTPKPVS